MTIQPIACTLFPVGANLFARHRTPGYLRRDDQHASLNQRGVALQRLSHLPNGLIVIAHGQASKFGPIKAKAAWPSGKSIGLGRQSGFTCGFRYVPPCKLGDVPQFLSLTNGGILPATATATANCRRN